LAPPAGMIRRKMGGEKNGLSIFYFFVSGDLTSRQSPAKKFPDRKHL
jgi:hypothetical protein